MDEFAGEGAGGGEQTAVDTSTVVHEVAYRDLEVFFLGGRGRRGGINSGGLGVEEP